ncbi:MAG: anaerobic ribonucleoside-triphosphate reductase [bacterium]
MDQKNQKEKSICNLNSDQTGKLPFGKEFVSDVTDMALFVRTSGDDIQQWNKERISESLLKETGVDLRTALEIASEVEEFIKNNKLRFVSAPLLREIVNSKLLERGLEDIRKAYTRLGVPIYDVGKIIVSERNRDNANVPHGPEATNLTIAEHVKKEYALLTVFSTDVADAHARGDLHLHDLGMIDRPYCSGQSLEYVKKFGLDLTSSLAQAKPATNPEVLLAHLVKFSAALQCHFSGAIGWDAINLFFAPYIVGLSDKQINQLAQMLIFEFSQQSVARGGQAIFSDINLYWEVPKHFEDVQAIGPGGKFTGKTYKEYEKEAQKFVWEIFKVYMEGDAVGRPFFFPKPLLHITEKFFRTEGHEKFLEFICEVAAEKGNTYFVFDRGSTAKISQCCRLAFKLSQDDLDDALYPWKMRYSAMQNITVNLPRIAYKAKGDEGKLFSELTAIMELTAKAHRQKRLFMEHLLSLGADGPLGFLSINRDGNSYYRTKKASHLIGMVGLNEMVEAHIGKELHESKEAFKFGLKVIAHMNLETKRLVEKYNLKFVLEQTPAETTAYRFAKLDLKWYPEDAVKVLQGNIDTGEIYYTNSTLLNLAADLDPIERIQKEGIFHPLIEAGSISHIWLGEAKPPASSIANLIKKVFYNTTNDQVAFSPEFTACNNCGKVERGQKEKCSFCGSSNLDLITRVTGYFSRTSMWNKGKIGELKDRNKAVNQRFFNGK